MSLLVELLEVNLILSSFFEVHIQWSYHSHMSYLISSYQYTIKEVMIDIYPTIIVISLMG